MEKKNILFDGIATLAYVWGVSWNDHASKILKIDEYFSKDNLSRFHAINLLDYSSIGAAYLLWISSDINNSRTDINNIDDVAKSISKVCKLFSDNLKTESEDKKDFFDNRYPKSLSERMKCFIEDIADGTNPLLLSAYNFQENINKCTNHFEGRDIWNFLIDATIFQFSKLRQMITANYELRNEYLEDEYGYFEKRISVPIWKDVKGDLIALAKLSHVKINFSHDENIFLKRNIIFDVKGSFFDVTTFRLLYDLKLEKILK